MKKIFLLLLVLVYNTNATDKSKKLYGKELFPLSATKEYIYNSTFGDTKVKAFIQNDLINTKSESEKFKYYQKLELKNDGIFVNNTYQWVKVFLFINQENTITYLKPLRRYALPLFVGLEWKDETTEFIDDEGNPVKLSAKVLAEETIKTEAGTFNTLKIQTIVESKGGSKNIVTEWLAENIGMVKTHIEIQGGGLTGMLRDLLGFGTVDFELKKIIQ
ncbi:MAG: DUF3108 domain-containing protein [Melioribacteraceae bacterium]|nr:DUF3108 domain-containing protein [Melioribacteraceae bacterium]